MGIERKNRVDTFGDPKHTAKKEREYASARVEQIIKLLALYEGQKKDEKFEEAIQKTLYDLRGNIRK